MGELFEEDKITEQDLIDIFVKYIKQEKIGMFSLKVKIPYNIEDYFYFDEITEITIKKDNKSIEWRSVD